MFVKYDVLVKAISFMRSFVDNKEVKIGSIGPPAMNYGQHSRWKGCPRCHYRLIIPIAELLCKVTEPFDQFRREVAEDMADHANDWPEPEFVRFRQLEFPRLSVLLEQYPDLLSVLLAWNDCELLNWLQESEPSTTALRYSINSIDRCSVTSEAIEVEGVAYELRSVP